MTLGHGPKIITKGLVFAYDMGSVQSYPKNVHPYPTDLYSWVTSGYQQTISRDTTIPSPVGNKPLKIVTSGSSSYSASYNNSSWNLGKSKPGDTWTASFWVKGSGDFQGRCIIFEANDAGAYLSASTLSYNITSQWTRVSVSKTFSNASVTNMQFRFDIYVSGVTVWYDGLQLERNTVMTSFSKLTNTNGSQLLDWTGNQTITANVTYNSDGTFKLNSSNPDYLDLGSDKTIKTSGGWTVESWVKYDTVPGSYDNVNSPGNFIGSDTVSYNSWYWSVLSSKLALWNISPGTWRYGSTTLQANIWYHAVLVCAPSGTSYQMYLNGVAEGGDHTTYTSWSSSHSGLKVRYMGRGNSGNTRRLNGSLPTTRIYDRPLSATEVAQNFQALRGRYGI